MLVIYIFLFPGTRTFFPPSKLSSQEIQGMQDQMHNHRKYYIYYYYSCSIPVQGSVLQFLMHLLPTLLPSAPRSYSFLLSIHNSNCQHLPQRLFFYSYNATCRQQSILFIINYFLTSQYDCDVYITPYFSSFVYPYRAVNSADQFSFKNLQYNYLIIRG